MIIVPRSRLGAVNLNFFRSFPNGFLGYKFKIPNHNTQISNNIKIPSSNDQNISITYLMSRCHFICFEFGPFEFVEPALERLDWFKPSSVLEFQLEVIITVRVYSVWAGDLIFGAWYFQDFYGRATLLIPINRLLE